MEPPIKVGLLTGGGDKPYAFGLATALLSKGLCLDFVGSDDLDIPELHACPTLNFLKLRGSQTRDAALLTKAHRILSYYARLLQYAWIAKPKIFHILWNNRFEYFDRTLLMLYYKSIGKRVVFTAHNVNAAKRDSRDSWWNRLTLKVQYRLTDHIFVHTERMKLELIQDFGVREQAVTVIPFGINNSAPQTLMTPAQARRSLGIKQDEKVMLFFGRIKPYKGLEFMVAAFQKVAQQGGAYRLIIVGGAEKDLQVYLSDIQDTIARDPSCRQIIQRTEFVPDEETELYFKAADVLVLPYTQVFQSGVLFLAYSFGLPVIAADVGSFRDDIIVGKTGYLCAPCNAAALAGAIAAYFDSDLFRSLDRRRQEIRDYACARNSWKIVSDKTCEVYAQLLEHTT